MWEGSDWEERVGELVDGDVMRDQDTSDVRREQELAVWVRMRRGRLSGEESMKD